MAIIGILPASGKASRVGGIPKFCLPISDDRSLIQWHVNQMLEVCDEVRVSTRSEWIPIVQNMDMNIKLMVREPTTMSDAVRFMAGEHHNDTLVIGMPDTYMINCSKNIYAEMLQSEGDVVLGTWECHKELKGRVGQILVKDRTVIKSLDKTPDCDYNDMWGTMLLRSMTNKIDISKNHPGEQIQDWIDEGISVMSVRPGGQYMDIGTLRGLKDLYRKMEE